MATSLSQEYINFLRLAGLLLKIAPRAVRKTFDYEFNPTKLQQFLRKHRNKIHGLTNKTQFGILYPTDLDIQDNLPVETIHTTAADISRIKFYRNYIVHSESGEVTETRFSEIWNCAVKAILKIVPDLKSEIDDLMSATITNDSDIIDFIRLEKQMENTNQHLSSVIQKLEILEIENNNKRDVHKRTLTKWREIDKKYISTSATTFIVQALDKHRGVIITGSPGCGKSCAAYHVALTLEKVGYEIIYCDCPSEIFKQYKTEKFQIFVLDDICGKFSINQQKADSWEQNDGRMSMLIESCNQNDDYEDSAKIYETKFIITCRENIYSHKGFPKLTCFSLVQCNLSTKYKNSPDEMRNIALSYVNEETVNILGNICLYDFFPLLCGLYCTQVNRDPRFFTHPVEIIKKEIKEMKIKSETSFLCLSLLVINNNKCCKDKLESSHMKQLIKAICRESELESVVSIVSIHKCFERLQGIYITVSDNLYTAIHDKMFDIISAAVAPFIMNSLIEFVDIAFIAQRIQLSSCGQSSLPFVINIQPELEKNHLKRQYKEAMKGKYWNVFGSIQTENEEYRKLLLSFLKEQDTQAEITYVPNEDMTTPLFVSSYLGYIDFVEYFIDRTPCHFNVKDKDGRSFFYVACENGHISMIKYIMKYHYDINAEISDQSQNLHTKKNGQTALHAACIHGHLEVVELLIESGMNINAKSNEDRTPLHDACIKGQYDTVKLLLDLNGNKLNNRVDTTFKQFFGWSVLHSACFFGHTEIVKLLIEIGIDINDTFMDDLTPLHLACFLGQYDTVKFLLDLNDKPSNLGVDATTRTTFRSSVLHDQTLNSRVDTKTKTIAGCSVLHTACYFGHTQIVKLFIDIGMNINDTSENGFTPLYLACDRGRYDTVKYLLDLNGKKINSRVDTTTKLSNNWSILHSACWNGHTKVVNLLIEIGININDTSKRGDTPLYLACERGHYDTVKYLLDLNGRTSNSRVDTTIRNIFGWSVLQEACFGGHKQVVKLLIDVGMNVNDTSKTSLTPLYYACTCGDYDTVKFLLDLKDQTLNSRVDTTTEINGESVLHRACANGHTQVVKLLIETGLNINDTSYSGATPLHCACQRGQYDIVKLLLDLNGQTLNSRVDTAIKKKDGWTVLHLACFFGHTEVVKLLVDVGMNVNDTTNEGYTPLNLACRRGQCDTVKLLLDLNGQTLNSRVDITIKEEDGWTVLHLACLYGHTEVVKLLVDVGMNVNDTTNKVYTPLNLACRRGQYDIFKLLLDINGQTFNSRVEIIIEEDGWTVLHLACLNGHTEVVKLLVDVGMNVNDTTNKGSTPLNLACERGQYDIVKLLLDLNGQTLNSRVDTTIKDEDGWTVLHLACFFGHTEVVKLLVDVGMNVNDTTNKGSTPLNVACERGQYDIVKLLLDLNGQTLNSRVDTTIKDEDGWTVLHLACFFGHTEVVKLLVDVGMNVNDITNEGYTPLNLACRRGQCDTVKLLLDLNGQTLNSRVDITIKEEDGWSVLHLACLYGHTEVVKLLVDVGMNVNDTTNEGYTPLNLACRRGQCDIVKFLLDLKGQTLNSRVDTTTKFNGDSILHLACLNGHTEVVKLLVDVGMNVNDTTNKGFTPLNLACERGQYDTVKLLLDLNGQTLNSRVDTTIKDEDGWTVLHLACFYGHTEVVKLLVDVGMNVNDTTKNGSTPLNLACRRGQCDTVKLLLDLNGQTLNSRVDTTIKDKAGRTVLHLACLKGHTKVVKLLVDVGLNLNETTNVGDTPLYLACREGHHDTVKFLLNINGKQINSLVEKTIDNKNEQSALRAAYSNGHIKVVKLLNDAGINEETRNMKNSCMIL